MKSLLIKTNNGFVVAVLPGDKRLDAKKLKQELNAKDMRFARPEEVKEVMGCEIGACYPFGNLIDKKIIVDPALAENETVVTNPGVHDKTIKMKWADFASAVDFQTGDISK